jgi:dynein heavy chain
VIIAHELQRGVLQGQSILQYALQQLQAFSYAWQLQDHYDFGMRALKSVLVMAGSLKRANPDLPEDIVLIRAMRDSNLPKFPVADVELFSNIISDLFPGVNVPDQVMLAASVRANCRAPGLQQQRGLSRPVRRLE